MTAYATASERAYFRFNRDGIWFGDIVVPWGAPIGAVIGTYVVTIIADWSSNTPPDAFRAHMRQAIILTPMFMAGAVFTEFLIRRTAG